MPKYEGMITKTLIVSRINDEKLETIFEGIDVFKKLLEKYPNAELNIIGGGNSEDKLEQFLKNKELEYTKNMEKQAKVKILGEQNDVIKYLRHADLLLGVDRCALEAIAMKVPVVITGYNGLKGLITKENIDLAIEENFSGDNMRTINIDDCINQILELEKNRKSIVEENYDIAKEKLDSFKNYINIEEENIRIKFDWIQLFQMIKKSTDLIEEQSADIKAKYEWIQKIEKDNEELVEKNKEIEEISKEKEEKLKEKNEELKKELNEVYNSKRWRYTEKISRMFHKNKD